MKIADAFDNYDVRSVKASEVGRQLALGGLAVIWLFKADLKAPVNGATVSVPHALYLPTLFLVLTLAFDLLHYVSSAILWGSFARFKELEFAGQKKRAETQGVAVPVESEFKAPRSINWPGNTFFVLKLASLFVAYVCIVKFLCAGVQH